jgi:hypothetical protein
MNPSQMNRLCLLAALVWLAPFSSQAQPTNRAALIRAAATRVVVPPPVVTRPVPNAGGGGPTVEVKLPKNLSRYHVLEQRAQTTRLATNLTATSTNQVLTALAPGSTLLFMEKESPAAIKPSAPRATRPLFSTFLLKSVPPARPGEPSRTTSGTLTLLADVPTPWDGVSNAYVARLSVMFLTEDAAPNNPLLPMAVEFSGSHVKSIQPRKVELRKAGVDGSEEVIVTCDRYRTDVQVTAYYQTTNTTRELTLQRLTAWEMTQMIIPPPMLFAALTGGLIGGLLRLFRTSKRELSRTLRYLAEGVVVGLVTVTLLLSGLLHSQIAGMQAHPQLVLAFSLAAAAGSVGAHFLDQAVKRLRGKQTP